VLCLQEVDNWHDVMRSFPATSPPLHSTYARKGDPAGLFTSCITSADDPRARAPLAGAAAVHDGCVCAWSPAKFKYVWHQVVTLPSPSAKPGVALMTLLNPIPLSNKRAHAAAAAGEFPPLARTDTDSPKAKRKAVDAGVGGGGGGGGSGGAEVSGDAAAAALRPILVVTTHLVYNKNQGNIKLDQLHIIFLALHGICSSFGGSAQPAVIFAGDFNSTPSSAIYSLITTGTLRMGLNASLLSGQNQVHLLSQLLTLLSSSSLSPPSSSPLSPLPSSPTHHV
jgi:hypothetical protein